MYISEIFHSIQGEGELTGVPSVFVRTSGCNLRCAWCDTPYASWKPEGTKMPLESVLEEIRQYPARHCVITGGEPMIAQEVRELTSTLMDQGYHITIETAGTIAPNGIACDLASISPKLANSTPKPGTISEDWIARHDATRLQPEVLRQWLDGYDYQLKFVISEEADLQDILELIALIDRDIPPHKILLMPEGITPEALRSRRDSLVELCKKHGYRFCERLHIELFGNTPGT